MSIDATGAREQASLVRAVRAVTTSTAAAALLLGTAAGAAQAETVTHRDATHDVQGCDTRGVCARSRQYDLDLKRNRNLDVVATRYTYGPRQMVAVVRFRDLTRVRQRSDTWSLRTPAGVYRAVVDSGRGDRAGRLRWSAPAGARAVCRGLRHHLDYAADVITIRVPDRCTGDPRWARFAWGTLGRVSATVEAGDQDRRVGYADQQAPFGPRVHRG